MMTAPEVGLEESVVFDRARTPDAPMSPKVVVPPTMRPEPTDKLPPIPAPPPMTNDPVVLSVESVVSSTDTLLMNEYGIPLFY